MRYLKIFIVSIIFIYPAACFSQRSILALGPWNISALSGEIKGGALYGGGLINTYGIDNRFTSSNYYAGMFVKSSSYIWNPSFLTVDVDGGYFPESRQDLYLVTSNIYNVINTSKLHLGTTLFPKKPITLSTYLNFDNSYDRRENLTDIRTNSETYGGTFAYRNNFLPLICAYHHNEWDSREILTGRDFYYLQKNFEARVYKTFRKRDRNDLIYTHNDYFRRDYGIYENRNVADNIELLDGIFLDSAGKSHFNSNIMGTVQKGNDSFKQIRADENLFYQLLNNFTLNTNYGYDYLERIPEKLSQHSFSTLLGHQLFESLHSGMLYEYNNASDISYHEVNDKVGADLNYTKKTFANGVLNILYSYNRIYERRNSTDVLLKVLNEAYTISDRVLIKRPYVIPASIVIKDTLGVIYQQGPDYVLNIIGSFVEIQRVPGGLIPDNGRIFVFYDARQPGTYSYDINTHNFSIYYSLFNQFLNVYYKTYRMDYANIHNADNLLLNYLAEDIYGANIKYKTLQAGLEYDDYKSNLTPYRMTRYFFIWQGTYKQKLLYSINGNWRDYKLPSEDQHRIYKDINGMFAYAVSQRSRVEATIGYQTQHGRQINLDLFTLRTKYSLTIKQITFVAGFDSYDRVYLENQKTNYLGGYIQVIKKFKY